MGNNYSAWKIDFNNFSDKWSDAEKLKYFARYAILAPSGHNTQPWHFSTAEDSLLLHANPERILPYSGIKANEPYVSLGACLETFNLAALGFGYKLKIENVDKEKVVARISIIEKTKPDHNLLEAIVNRVSNRQPYDISKKIPEKIIDTVSNVHLSNVKVQSISSNEDIEYIAEQTTLATHTIMSDKQFRSELSKWVRNNRTKKHDGMPAFVQGIPTPPSMLAKHIIKRFNISKSQAKKDATRVRKSPNLLMVTITKNDSESLINGGRLYAQICVLAQKEGIATTGVGASIIDGATLKNVVKHFDLEGKPIAIIRLGRAIKSAKHTPRWPLDSLIVEK